MLDEPMLTDMKTKIVELEQKIAQIEETISKLKSGDKKKDEL